MKTHLLALALMLGVVAAAPSASAAGSSDIPPSAYPINWKQCPDRPEVQCGTLRVPLDWARRRREDHVALARHPATDPAHRIGALFFNPGGPGDGGVEIVIAADLIFSPTLGHASTSSAWTRAASAAARRCPCGVPVLTPTYTLFPRTERGVRALLRHNRAVGQSCLRADRALLGTLDTVSVARDHEAVRIALGGGRSTGSACPTARRSRRTTPSSSPAHPRDGAGLRAGAQRSEDQQVAEEIIAVEDSFNRFAAWCDTAPTCALRGQDVAAVYDRLVAGADRTRSRSRGRCGR